MAYTIDPERLKLVRKLRGLTQEGLAQKARVNKQTVYRLERQRKPIRRGNLERLAETLGVEPGVLTGEKPIPSDIVQASAAPDEIAYQLNVRVDAPVRNAFELVARRYRVSTTKIAQLAPLLFVIAAEASLKERRERLKQLADKFDCLVEEASGLGFIFYDLDNGIEAEQESIERHDIFGEERTSSDDKHNPFAYYIEALAKGNADISISALSPISTEYRVCRSEAAELAEGDEQIADWLLNGQIPIHRMPRGLTTAGRREWMVQNKVSVSKVPEEVPDGYPGDEHEKILDLLEDL